MRENRSKTNTQWAGHFYTAAELARREYIVTFTLGNVPKTDLLAASPSGKSFRIECKSQKASNVWLIGDVPVDKLLFYVLVHVPLNDDEPPRFYIVPSKDAKRLVLEERKRTISRGTNPDTFRAGFPYSQAKPFQDAWHKLPK